VHTDGQLTPDGELVTVPLPETLTLSVYWVCANVAVTLCAPFIVTTQLPTPLQAPPQPLKPQPFAGVAVSVTCVAEAKFALHVDGQLIPAGELVTVPLPVTLTDNATFCTNVAVTDAAAFIVTEHPALPLQAPPQLLKVQPLAGVAVKVTGVPLANPALHVDGQLMPAGLLVTVPLPVTLTVRTVEFETLTAIACEGMPFATTTRLLAPVSIFAGTAKFVDPAAFGAIDIVLWLDVRA
jgi:phage tail protein X